MVTTRSPVVPPSAPISMLISAVANPCSNEQVALNSTSSLAQIKRSTRQVVDSSTNVVDVVVGDAFPLLFVRVSRLNQDRTRLCENWLDALVRTMPIKVRVSSLVVPADTRTSV